MKHVLSSRVLITSMLLLCALPLTTGCSDDDDPAATPAPTVHDDLVGIWQARSVTVDGTPQDLADFFEFSPVTEVFLLTIDADASYHAEERDEVSDSGNVVYYEDGTAVSVGQTLTLTKTAENGSDLPAPEVVATGTWEVDLSWLTFTMEDEGHTVVISWSDWMM